MNRTSSFADSCLGSKFEGQFLPIPAQSLSGPSPKKLSSAKMTLLSAFREPFRQILPQMEQVSIERLSSESCYQNSTGNSQIGLKVFAIAALGC